MKEFAPRRGSTPPPYQPEVPRHAPNAALLIDFDNVTMGVRSDLQEQLKRLLNSEVFKGKISVQRAYADWRRYPQYIVPLSEASIDLIFAPAFGSNKKNATDIRLAIDALELVFTRPEIGTFVLLSGDSDFSSLVLKLKEYGKYVIGIGIRESSSDLLIQNCDEYYSYSDLTGLLKESEIEHRRRDPWELIVQAVLLMQERDDVMRSDRLKQVMQELDPNFDEKDAGYSRYSKFLQEAQRRGLIGLTKMDNGQYEVALGPDANVPPETAPEADPGPSAKAPADRRGERDREKGRDRGERRGRTRARGPRAEPSGRGMSLAQAFDLLRGALQELGARDDESTDAEQARERMIQRASDANDPVFDEKRFQRLLRQAHDAGVIDLVKSGEDAYLLKLRPSGDEAETPAPEEPEARPKARRGRRSGRGEGREPSRGREAPAPAAEAPAAEDGPSRNPRYRRGGRGRGPQAASPEAPAPPPGPVGPATEPEPEAVTRPAATAGHRSLRLRPGHRALERRPAEPSAGTGFVPGPVGGDVPGEPTPSREAPEPPRPPAPAPPAAEPDRAEPAEGGGLFRRMTAAFQRAVGGERSDDSGE